jgi:hypothetical protein
MSCTRPVADGVCGWSKGKLMVEQRQALVAVRT